jgi:hypothetical protein
VVKAERRYAGCVLVVGLLIRLNKVGDLVLKCLRNSSLRVILKTANRKDRGIPGICGVMDGRLNLGRDCQRSPVCKSIGKITL